MSTAERFSMPAYPGRTRQARQRSPRVIRFLGASGTAQEWAEDSGAVLAGVVLVAMIGAMLAMVGR